MFDANGAESTDCSHSFRGEYTSADQLDSAYEQWRSNHHRLHSHVVSREQDVYVDDWPTSMLNHNPYERNDLHIHG